jgi:signal transduction histidine kinase
VARTSIVDRLKGIEPRTIDLLLTAGLTFLGVGGQLTATSINDELFRDTDAFAVVLGLATTLPLYWRRRYPLGALAVSSVAITVLGVADYRLDPLPIAVFFLIYANGAYATRPRATAGLAVVNVCLLVIFLSDAPDLDFPDTVLNIAVYSTCWLVGQVVRARGAASAARLAEAEERAEAQRQHSARAVAEERLRIAQELHDVVAHSMSVIAVQAGMGVHVIDRRPEDAKAALEAISHTSRRTLQEMRRLLGVLRDEEGELLHSPAPGLADLPRLVDDVRGAGVPVELAVEGEQQEVPHAVELSVYRLVQEGLTNVIKHAGKASASVTVRCLPSTVEVEVIDDGRGAASSNGASGHGLQGMQERVALWGGTLQAGPRQGGGFRVLAELPYGDAS